MRKISLVHRTLFLAHPMDYETIAQLTSPVVFLLVAETEVPAIEQQRIIDIGISNGAVEFCCIGKHSEMWHDAIDHLLEEKELFDVVTTWQSNESNESLQDSIYYFIQLAGMAHSNINQEVNLVALFGENRHIQDLLEKSASEEEQCLG